MQWENEAEIRSSFTLGRHKLAQMAPRYEKQSQKGTTVPRMGINFEPGCENLWKPPSQGESADKRGKGIVEAKTHQICKAGHHDNEGVTKCGRVQGEIGDQKAGGGRTVYFLGGDLVQLEGTLESAWGRVWERQWPSLRQSETGVVVGPIGEISKNESMSGNDRPSFLKSGLGKGEGKRVKNRGGAMSKRVRGWNVSTVGIGLWV